MTLPGELGGQTKGILWLPDSGKRLKRRRLTFLFQKHLHFHSRHAACSCRGDCLLVAAVLDFAAGEDAEDFGGDVVFCHQVAVAIGV